MLHLSIICSKFVKEYMDQKIQNIIENRNGYLLTRDMDKHNISRQTMQNFIQKNNFQKVGRGIYLSEDTFGDILYVAYLSHKKIVYSHETALDLHGLTEREPSKVTCTVVRGTNTKQLLLQYLQVYTAIPKYYNLAQTTIKTAFGNTVPVYDVDRTICDIVRIKDTMDIQVFTYAMKQYMNSNKKNLHNLIKYSQILRIEDKVRQYVEVM